MKPASRAPSRGDRADTERSVRSSRIEAALSSGWWLLALVVLTFLILYGSVLVGQQVMIGGGLLAGCCYPWAATPGPHPVQNVVFGDPETAYLPWQIVVEQAFRSGHLPLWNPYALWGSPLLANGLSAPFSPFTWLALLFSPAQGLSMAMLAKMWTAGVGTALYLRLLGVRGLGQVVGGIGFAASSFMVDWLAWAQTTPACLMPWVFAAVEWSLQSRSRWAWCATATTVALQFLGGHAEVSLHLALGVTIYGIVRWSFGERRLSSLIHLLSAAAVGVLLAAIQLVPFVFDLQGSAAGVLRSAGVGTNRLRLLDLATWLTPNAHGNPAIDHVLGPLPNYAEAVAFAGVTLLVMAVPGLLLTWRRIKGAVTALATVGVVAAGTAYGPLNEVVGRLPGYDTAANTRIVVLLCFVVPALGALGIDALCVREVNPRWPRMAGVPLLALGILGTAALVAAEMTLATLGARVATFVPDLPHQLETFWVGVSFVTLLAAVAYLFFGLMTRHGTVAATGLAALVLLEAILFSVPYQPRSDPATVPPQTAVTSWLQEHQGNQYIAAVGHILPPETATLYGLHDARAYDLLLSPRALTFWSAADPGFSEAGIQTTLGRPNANWLAAAGIKYVLTGPGGDIPGTMTVTRLSGLDVDAVPDAATFATVSSTWRVAGSPGGAVQQLTRDTLGPPVLEKAPTSPAAGNPSQSSVRLLNRGAQSVTLRTHSSRRVAVTVRQSYSAGWEATIDGRPAPIYPADVVFQSIIVPAGSHSISLHYQPASVTIGIIGSLGGLVLVLFVILMPVPARRLRARQRRKRDRLEDQNGMSA